MANMGYCKFQNTLGDLCDCLEALADGGDLSAEEVTARGRLIKVCQDIVEQADFAGLLDEDGYVIDN